MNADADRLTAQDLADFRHLIPDNMLQLVAYIGERPALALMNTCMGATLRIPKHSDNNQRGARRWEMLAEIVGEDGMNRLSAAYGGECLSIPVFRDVQAAKRARWVRDQFHLMTAPGAGRLTSGDARLSLCMDLSRAGSPMTERQIHHVLNG